MRINSNEGISPKVTNTDQYPFNEWHTYVVNHQIEFSFIKMKVDAPTIKKLLAKEKNVTNYVTMLSIVYYITKIEDYGEETQISEQASTQIMQKAYDYLNTYKFFSIAEKRKLRRQAQSESERNALISSFDKKNSELINDILAAFRVFSELNIVKTNEYLSLFVKNLTWDISFMMKLIGTSFYEMEDLSFSIKKRCC